MKEEFYGKIETKLNILYDEKFDTESTFKEDLYKFPDDDHMKELYEDFIELFLKDDPVNDNPCDKPDDKPDDDQDDDDQAGREDKPNDDQDDDDQAGRDDKPNDDQDYDDQAGRDDKPDDEQDDNDKPGGDDFDTTGEKEEEINPKTKDVQQGELEKGGLCDDTEDVSKLSEKNSECVHNPAENIFVGITDVVKQLNGTDWENSEYGESFTQWIDDACVNDAFENFDSLLLKSNSLKSFKPIVDDNEMPSFSLGVTQKSTFSSLLPVVSLKNLTPLLSFEDEVPKTADKINDKRSVKPCIHISSPFVCSPYINKKVNAKRYISKSELSVSNSLFSMVRDEIIIFGEPVFQSTSGQTVIRLSMESLAPSLWIYGSVIDIWSDVLNHEEQHKSPDSLSRLSRLFFPSEMITRYMLDGTSTKAEQFHYFYSKIMSVLNKDAIKMSLKETDLVFFPIVALKHSYLLVFNLRRVAFNIIDYCFWSQL